MTCQKCGHEQPDTYGECQKCGVIFTKIHTHDDKAHIHFEEDIKTDSASHGENAGDIIFAVKRDGDPIILGLKSVFVVVVFIWGIKLFFSPVEEAGNNILHYVNL